MAIRSIAQLKAWFQRGKYPTEAQFADWIDSFIHKEEDKVPISSVEGLSEQLNGKYDAAQAQELQKQVEIAVSRAEANQKDIDALYTNVEELEAEDERLDSRITSGDEATLRSANTYTDTALAGERIVIDLSIPGYESVALEVLTRLNGNNFPAIWIIDAEGAHHIGSVMKTSSGYLFNTDTISGNTSSGIATLRQRRFLVNDRTGSISSEMFKPLQNLLTTNLPDNSLSGEAISDGTLSVAKLSEETRQMFKIMHSVSYAELVALRDGKQLRSGHHYRITDFVTTVANDAEARSAGHPFDIIVLATAADTLSEEARAIMNENYAEYFATANLAAWKVWYCLDNDISRFQWADETNGHGVIYRLVDEWQNDCPYDFKNIQFKRYRASTTGALTDAINGRYYAFRSGMPGVEIEDVDDFMWAYTFTLIDDSGQWRDYSVMKDALDAATDWGYFKQFGIGRCEYNLIRNSYAAVTVDEKCYRALMLNNIVLLAEFDDSGLPGEMQLNIFGDGNYNMTLKDDPEQNHFGNKCYGNIVGAYGNTFGNGCSSITFGNGCSSNTFGNNVQYSALGAYLYCTTVHDGVKYVAVVGGASNRSYVQYAQILNGTSGSSGTNRLQISFKANVKYCQFAGLNSSGILKIWTPADLV